MHLDLLVKGHLPGQCILQHLYIFRNNQMQHIHTTPLFLKEALQQYASRTSTPALLLFSLSLFSFSSFSLLFRISSCRCTPSLIFCQLPPLLKLLQSRSSTKSRSVHMHLHQHQHQHVLFCSALVLKGSLTIVVEISRR